MDRSTRSGLRILLLNYEYPPLGGGAGVATAALAQRLAKRGVTVDVVTARADGIAHDRAAGTPPRSSLGDGAGPSSDQGLTIYRVRSWRTGIHQAGMIGAGGYLLHALPVIRRLVRRNRYDVAHLFFSLPTGALLPVAGLAGMPVVVSLRGSDVPGYDRSNRTLVLAHRALRPVTRWIWRRADHVVAVCESLGRLAQETLPELRFGVIRNGVDLQRFRPAGEPRGASGPVRCVAAARLVERKGVAHLLRACQRLRPGSFHLEIIGTGPDEQSLRQLAAELGVGDHVRFAGALDQQTLAERYRQADLFTLAPLEEAFGNVFAEALASGLPIVGSDVGGVPDIVRQGENGILVPPAQPDALATAIQRLIDDPDRRAEIAKRNRIKAETTLSWDHATDRYLDIYHELAARSGAAASPGPTAASG